MHSLAPVACSLVLTAVLGVVCWAEFSSFVPHDMSNQTEWRLLEAEVLARSHAASLAARVGLLLGLHMGHIYLCMPMLHLTKVAYGVWLGLGLGWLLCCAWELLLFATYLACMPRSEIPAVVRFTRSSRAAGHLLYDNTMFAISSFPLHVSASLVLSGDVSVREFMLANTLVTAALTLKNVACGAVLAASPSQNTLVALAALLTASTLLPTVATLYVTSKGLFVATENAPAANAPKAFTVGRTTESRPDALPTPCSHGEDEALCP